MEEQKIISIFMIIIITLFFGSASYVMYSEIHQYYNNYESCSERYGTGMIVEKINDKYNCCKKEAILENDVWIKKKTCFKGGLIR